MSGIWGIIEKQEENIEELLLEEMGSYIYRHGNDKTKTINYKNIGFGHKQLYTTEESLHESQPLISEDRLFIITADIRIDNRKELIEWLYPEICETGVINDVDLLLFSYKKWSEECLKYIVGDFAFVILDTEKEQLFCARDRIGIKPFYYCDLADRFVFSSEVAALINLPGYVRKPYIPAMFSFLDHTASIEYGHTMFENIFSLPPACYLVYKNKEIETTRYWYPEDIKIQKNISLKDASKLFLDLFEDAVSCRMRSAFPIGFELSGGLDSSSIVSISEKQKISHKKFALSILFQKFEKDESEYINAVLAESNMQHITVDGSTIDYKKIDILDWTYEINSDWPNRFLPFLTWNLMKEAQKQDIRIILNGLGGDELVTGNFEMLTDYVKEGKWISLYNELKSYPYKKRLIKKYVILPFLSENNKKIIKNILEFLQLRKIYIGNKKINIQQNLIDPSKCESLSQHAEIESLCGVFHADWADNNPSNIAGLYNIEYRSPFYDTRLIEFLLSLPNEFKLSKRKGKIILREAMQGILAEKVRVRNDKFEFSEIVFQFLSSINLGQFLEKMYIIDFNVITSDELNELILEYKTMGTNTHPSIITKLWNLINLEKWYRVNFIVLDKNKNEKPSREI